MPRNSVPRGPRPPRADPVPWDESVVTLMIRQLPRQFTQLALLQEVNQRGFEGLFDFFYLPYDLNKGVHVGFGFINFIEPKYALEFHAVFDGGFLDEESQRKGKPLRVHPASVQGYEANYAHFANTKTGQMQDPQLSPLFFPPGSGSTAQGLMNSYSLDAKTLQEGSGAPALAAVAAAARATAESRSRSAAMERSGFEGGYPFLCADPPPVFPSQSGGEDPMKIPVARTDHVNLDANIASMPQPLHSALAPGLVSAPAPPTSGVSSETLRELKQEVDEVQEQLVKAAAWVLASAACQSAGESGNAVKTATLSADQ